jgi:hypothetical protein
MFYKKDKTELISPNTEKLLLLFASNLTKHINSDNPIDRDELFFIINDSQSLRHHMIINNKLVLIYRNVKFTLDENKLLDYKVLTHNGY